MHGPGPVLRSVVVSRQPPAARRACPPGGLGRASPRSRARGEGAPRWGFMPGAVTATE